MSTVYIVATPIGNLDDISKNLIDTLSSVDIILAEDTRRFQKLRSHILQTYPDVTITQSILRFDEHTEQQKVHTVLEYLDNGQNIALVSDAGTPLISDPGSILVRAVTDEGAHTIKSIPGPSSVISALVLSGLPTNSFMFLGYFPKKNSGKKMLHACSQINELKKTTFIAFASPHRLVETLKLFREFENNSNSIIYLALLNELTKQYEKRFFGTAETLLKEIGEGLKGECVLVWSIR